MFTIQYAKCEKIGVAKIVIPLLLASKAKATHGTSTYPLYVGAPLPIGTRGASCALLDRNIRKTILFHGFCVHPGLR